MAEAANDNLVQRSNQRMDTYRRAALMDAASAAQHRLTVADWQRALNHITKEKQR